MKNPFISNETRAASSVLFDEPGPIAQRRTRIFNIAALVVFAIFAVYVLIVMGEKGQLEAEKWTDLFTARAWTSYYLPGLVSTLSAAAISVVTSIAFGLVFGVARLSQYRVIRWIGTVVVEFFRAVPVLIMMIFFWLFLGKYSGLPPAQLPFIAVVVGLTLYNGSVIAELLRSGVKQLPRGQGEAGLAIGLTPSQTLIQILIPQAFTAMMPSMLSQFVVILKDTALGYIISYPELLASARRIGSGDGNVLQTLLLAAALFVWWLLERSTIGFEFRATGLNPAAARTAGISVEKVTTLVMIVSGALCGLAGSAPALGTERYLTTGIAASIGFDAITVALLGKSRPLGTVLAGLLFGALKAGGAIMQTATQTPIDIVLVIQSTIVLFIAAPPLVRAIFRLPEPLPHSRIAKKEVAA